MTKTYTYPTGNNKLTSITGAGTQTFVHDPNGSITGDGTNSFTYDTKGRLVQASTALGTVTYQVNALGQRYSKTLQGTTTVYLYDRSGKLIAETTDAGATYTQYVWLHDTPVAVLKPSTPTPARYYVHSDHLDTPRVITDQGQNLRWRWDNDDPFGANMASENPSGLGAFAFNLRFPGQYFDKETNQHYNYYRDYSPEVGRYIESDPIGLHGGLNTYAYVYDNPLVFADRFGLDNWWTDPPINRPVPYPVTYNLPPPDTLPVPANVEAQVICMAKCLADEKSCPPLVITGGSEGFPYHLGPAHPAGRAVDLSKKRNPALYEKYPENIIGCALQCEFTYGWHESRPPHPHWHFQNGPGGGVPALPTPRPR